MVRIRWVVGSSVAAMLAACGGGGGGADGGGGGSHTLSVAVAGGGSGTVTSSPGGISCSSGTCTASVAEGTWVALTATPGDGSAFVGWTGACGGGGTCAVPMNGDVWVTATFESSSSPRSCEPWGLWVWIGGEGSGTVTGPGISCSSGWSGTCGATYPWGTQVALTATANDGSTFAGWGGACSGTGGCQITLQGDCIPGELFDVWVYTTFNP